MQNKMRIALEEARKAFARGEVPIGAALFKGEELIARAHNRCEADKDALAHAEMLVIAQAQQALGRSRLNDCALYVTVEPCCMCVGAILAARIGKLVYGVEEPRTGCIYSKMNIFELAPPKQLEVYGSILEEESKNLMQKFFSEKR